LKFGSCNQATGTGRQLSRPSSKTTGRAATQITVPKVLFCDYGSEFTSQAMDLWASVQIDFSRPGKPTDSAHVELFNGTLQAECLDTHWFTTLAEAKQIAEA
jgi:putative transposase